jgi:hypothetical protein
LDVVEKHFLRLGAVDLMGDVLVRIILDLEDDFSAKVEIEQRLLISEDACYFMDGFF